MATWITTPIVKNGSSAESNRPAELLSGTGGCTASTGTTPYMFYSNNPETVQAIHTAGNKKFLNQGTVNGACQIYCWHKNSSGAAVTAVLQVYNPNSYQIKVNATNYGETLNRDTDAQMGWYNYYRGQNKSITVPSGGYVNLFTKSVPNTQNWGFVARVSITNSSTGASASAGFTEFCYKSTENPSGATSIAAVDGSGRVRGIGRGYYTYLDLATITVPAGVHGYARRFGGINRANSIFSGNELVSVTSPGGGGGGKIAAGFGQQFEVTLRVKNGTTSAGTFDIYVGSNGGSYFPFVNFGANYYYTASLGAYQYAAVLRTESLAINATSTAVKFAVTVPAGSNAPILIGARKT